jgi:hypothetical protein
LPAGPVGWDAPRSSYVFEVDDKDLDQLPELAADRYDVKQAILDEAQRRDNEGLEVNAGIMYRWVEDAFRYKKAVLPTERGIRGWLAEWRKQGLIS